jgi:hypothetical protein
MGYRNQVKLWLIIIVLASAFLVGCGTTGAYQEAASGAAVNEHYADYSIDELDSYGEWVELPPYGRVWKPYVTQDWRPFYYGHWDWTAPNWTWISYEPFGWIVYHYGNWYYSGAYGWVWIPGNGPWSPARVEWMSYDDYVCWAPLPPRNVVLPRPWERDQNGIDEWSVVHARDFASDNVGRRSLESSMVRPRDEHVRTIGRFPDPRMVEKYSGQSVPNVEIRRQPVRVGKQEMQKAEVPPADRQRAEKHKPEVEKHVARRSGNHR